MRELPAPRAPRRPVERCHHGLCEIDDYAWLRDPGYPKVTDPAILAHLEAENAWFAAAMAPMRATIRSLEAEMRSRILDEDEGVPWREGDWLYRWRFEKGCEHRRWYRAPVSAPQEWRLILDEPTLAADAKAFRLAGWAVSPCGRLLAFATDRDGSERFMLEVRDLETGETVDGPIPDTIGTPVWAGANGRTLLYRRLNAEWRPDRVMVHRPGADPADDEPLHVEDDPGYFVHLALSQSRRFVLVSSASHDTSEVRAYPSDDLALPPRLFAPRREGHEYEVDHLGGRFLLRSNARHPDFDLLETGEDTPEERHWRPLLTGGDGRYVIGFVPFERAIAVLVRDAGVERLLLCDPDGGIRPVELEEEIGHISFGPNREADQDHVRIAFESLATPPSVIDVDLAAGGRQLRKVQHVPGFRAEEYETERLMIRGHDGIRIPVSLVRRRTGGGQERRPGPLHLYGYGAYGMGMTPTFSANRMSLLDRGVAFAIAHVRGGDEMGREWYEEGRRFLRRNTFHDFIHAALGLIERGETRAGAISISGGSAGGTLMGVAANWRPDLWAGVVAHVPFVDVLNTMLDESLPLTPIEWPEWGDPLRSKDAYRYIRSYSPYENVMAQDYPPMMVTAGLNDPRVTYWEPAKWVARLRERRSDPGPVILKTEMGAGHAGRSGRYAHLEEVAEEYAFILACHGLIDL
ncbi:MAG: S9 family peptidase [Alphaproteobacteria bacterium]|nr:MAG: S9 family peptidase [Alphaproteobacteria bacterium]